MIEDIITNDLIREYLAHETPLEAAISMVLDESGGDVSEMDIIENPWKYDKYRHKVVDALCKSYLEYPAQLYTLEGTRVDLDMLRSYKMNESAHYDVDISSQVHMSQKDYLLNDKNIYINRHMKYGALSFHNHEFIEICYEYSGTNTHVFKDKNQLEEKLILHEGDVVIIPPGMYHKVVDSKGVMINIVVNRNTFEAVFLDSIPNDSILYNFFSEIIFHDNLESYIYFKGKEEKIPETKDAVIDIIAEYLDDRAYSERICELKLSILFLQMLQSTETIEFQGNIHSDSRLMANALMYIERNYKHISLDGVCKAVGYSPSYMNRVFNRQMDKTVLEAIQEIRVDKAKSMLVNTSASVEEIAINVGYEETSYFIKLFKRICGMTPLQYRKKNS